ncbi:MAG: sensor histidine kinase [Bacteriovoracaceae bacterium]
MKESIISKEKALATSVAKETIAKQVAHDIRSPLAALDMIVNEVDQLPEEQRSIIRNATRRIHDIADNHLNRNSKNDKNLKDDIDQHMLSALIEPLMAEKRTQYRNKIGLEIEAEFNKENYGLFVNVNAVEFKRVLSNLVNNSVEALEGPGRVHVLTTYTESLAKIQITDNGPGIPKSILPHITEKGATFGKTGGTGLGLYHAKKSVESWGGHFEVLSRINQGTTIAITLPLVQTPKWFLSQLNLKPNQNLIILDDDITMHQVWKEILRKFELNECGINIKSFATAEQLRSWYLESDQNENNRYLFDYEILGTNTTGLDLIEELDLKGGRAILVTSHYESGEIRKRCEKIKVPLLPKNLAPFVPISINKEASTDAVFIDDDDLVRNLWKIKASLKDVKLKTFSNKDDLIKFLPEIQKFTPIYIDSNLGEDIKGEDLALELHDQGFSEIFLATGYDPSNYEGCHYLKGVIGKTPPF